MSILVTGGAGFIGSHFIELLLRNNRGPVVCLDNFNDYYDPRRKRKNIEGFSGDSRVTLVEADFCDEAVVERVFAEQKISAVVHLGAYAGVRISVERPLVYQRNNVGGTLVLLEVARKRPVERFLLVSSSTVYGQGADVPFCE